MRASEFTTGYGMRDLRAPSYEHAFIDVKEDAIKGSNEYYYESMRNFSEI